MLKVDLQRIRAEVAGLKARALEDAQTIAILKESIRLVAEENKALQKRIAAHAQQLRDIEHKNAEFQQAETALLDYLDRFEDTHTKKGTT